MTREMEMEIEIPALPKLDDPHPILGIYSSSKNNLFYRVCFYTVRICHKYGKYGFNKYVGMHIYFRTAEIRRKSTWRLKYEDHKEFHVCGGVHTHRR